MKKRSSPTKPVKTPASGRFDELAASINWNHGQVIEAPESPIDNRPIAKCKVPTAR